MTVKLKLLQKYKEYGVGDIVEVDAKTAESLKSLGFAQDYDEAAEAAEEAKKNKLDSTVKNAVGEAVQAFLKDFKGNEGININYNPVIEVKEHTPKFKSLGEQLVAVKNFVISGHMDPKLEAIVKTPTGYNETTGSEGGFLVQEDFQTELNKRMFQTGILSSKVQVVPVSANSNTLNYTEILDYDRTDGNRPVTGGWINEAVDKPASRASFLRRTLTLNKYAAIYYATDEILEDYSALEAEINQQVLNEIGFSLDEAIYDGNGTGKPEGYMQSSALVTVPKESAQTAATVNAANVLNMFARMPAYLLNGAEWYINQQLWPQLPQMTIGNQPIFLPPSGLVGAPAGTLLGKPVNMLEQANALGTAGDICFCNMSQYKMIRKGGVNAASSIHVRFIQDEVCFRFFIRVDGHTAWSDVITPYSGGSSSGANAMSPFVVLADRT